MLLIVSLLAPQTSTEVPQTLAVEITIDKLRRVIASCFILSRANDVAIATVHLSPH